jgi:AraC-like DNA-binding protein
MEKLLGFRDINNIIPHVSIVIDRTTYKGWSVPRRTIMDHELVLIIKGKGSFTIEGTSYSVQPGMLFYFHPHLLHSGNTDPNCPMVFFAVHFSFSIAQYMGGDFWSFDAKPPRLDLDPVTHLFTPYKINEIFKKIYITWERKEPGYQWKSNILLQKLLFEILFQQVFPPGNHADITRCERTMDYIRQHYRDDITIKKLSTLIDLSPGYFSKIFKRTVGKTPIEYLHQVRIDYSKELLLNTSFKIKDIAHRSGFRDEFYFTRVFKKLESCTPSQFREVHISN